MKYNLCKNKLDVIYEEGIKIRSKYQWYEQEENCAKLFLNIGKSLWMKDTTKVIESSDIEVNIVVIFTAWKVSKYGPEKNPYLETFHAVLNSW